MSTPSKPTRAGNPSSDSRSTPVAAAPSQADTAQKAEDFHDLVEDAVRAADALPGGLPAPIDTTSTTSEDASEGHVPKIGLGLLAAFTAVTVWASPALIGKALPLSSLTIVLIRGWIGVLIALSVLRMRGQRLSLASLRFCLLGGIALGFDLMMFYAAIKTTTVANATLISSMTPLLLIFLAPWLFGERLRLPDIAAALATIIGAAMVAFASTEVEGWSLRGDLYAASCLVAWTVYLAVSKSTRGKMGSLEFTAGVSLVASITITPIALLHADLSWPKPSHFLLLALMAIGGLLGHVLMNWSLQHIPLWAGGTAASAIPVVSTALAAVFLSEPFTPLQALGMGIVLVALTVVGVRSPKLVS